MANPTDLPPNMTGTEYDDVNTSDEDREFEELFRTPTPEQSDKAGGQPETSQASRQITSSGEAGLGRRQDDSTKRSFGKVDDPAEDSTILKAAGQHPTKKTRVELNLSSGQAPARPPQMPTLVARFPPSLPATMQPNPLGGPGRISFMPDTPRVLATPAEAAEIQRFSSLFDDDPPVSTNVGASFVPTSSATLPSRYPIASTSTAATTRYGQPLGSTYQPPVHDMQTIYRNAGYAPYQEVDPQPPSTAAAQHHEQSRQKQPPAALSQRQSQKSQSLAGPAKHQAYEIKDFPSRQDPMPPGLSLGEIARDYPNHVIGANIRPFILEGWSPKNIWDALRPSARVSASSDRGWNKFEQRMIFEKRRMKAEEQARQGIPGAIDDAGTGIQHPDLESTRSQRSNARSSTKNLSGAPQIQSAQSRETAATELPDHIVARREAIARLFTAEMSRQSSILYALRTRDDPEWPFKFQAQRLRNTEADWIRHAQRFERTLTATHGLTTDGIETEQTSMKSMLKRLRALLLQRSHLTLALVAGTEGVENVPSSYETQQAALEESLEIVQGWTRQWREQLYGPMQQNLGAVNNQLPVSSSPARDRRGGYTSEQAGELSGVLDPRLQNPSLVASETSVQERMHTAYQNFLAEQSQTGIQDRRPAGPRNVQQGHSGTGDPQLRFPDVPARSHTAYGLSHPQTSTSPAPQTNQQNLRRQTSAMLRTTSENTAATTATERYKNFSFEDYLNSGMLSDSE